MSTLTAKRWLAVVWLLLGGLAIAILIGQSFSGRYGARVGEAWNWFVPALVPTASLVFAAYGAGSASQAARDARTDVLLFLMSILLSVIYLGLILLTFFAQPFIDMSPLELMALSNIWLAVFQGILLSVLATLFMS
jgi:hypothetical protein